MIDLLKIPKTTTTITFKSVVVVLFILNDFKSFRG